MISVAASEVGARMATGQMKVMALEQVQSGPSEQMLYAMAALGVLSLLASLYCFYKTGRLAAQGGSNAKAIFACGAVLFIAGSFTLAYFSYSAGQNQVPYIGHPGFDPRAT